MPYVSVPISHMDWYGGGEKGGTAAVKSGGESRITNELVRRVNWYVALVIWAGMHVTLIHRIDNMEPVISS